jgi:hypothetical protein
VGSMARPRVPVAALVSNSLITWLVLACEGTVTKTRLNEETPLAPTDASFETSHNVPGYDANGGLIGADHDAGLTGANADAAQATETESGGCQAGEDAATEDARILDSRVDVEFVERGAAACLSAAPPPACGTRCGNGVRDACTGAIGYSDGGGPLEECDGTDLGGATCASLGYAGGALACSASCYFDISQCETYAPTSWPDGGILGPLAEGVALAAGASELGYAWIERDSACNGVRFDRYRPDLTRISESACLGLCDADNVSVAATSTGWLLVIRTTDGVVLLPVDTQGNPSGPIRTIAVDQGSPVLPTLTPRLLTGTVLGGPLLTWTDATGHLLAALLRGDGLKSNRPYRCFPILSRRIPTGLVRFSWGTDS